VGIHDKYGKEILTYVTEQYGHWFTKSERTVKYPPGGMTAELDFVIGEDCVVEIEGLNEKQIRAGILDLVFHPYPKKLLVIIPANLSKSKNKRQEDIQLTCQNLLGDLISAHYPNAFGRVVMLRGIGMNRDEFFDEDCKLVQQSLSLLGCKQSQ